MRICEVRVCHGQYIYGLRISRIAPDGTRLDGAYHGSQGGTEDSFTLKPGETIVAIRGRTGDFVDSIEFRTSAGASYGYGGDGGESSIDWDFGATSQDFPRFVGFFGRSGDLVDAIGCWIYEDPEGE
jgi:hypothetical protein